MLNDLIPHRDQMVLIDDVISFDQETQSLRAGVTIKPAWCESYVAIEFMAQTAAALAGSSDRAKGYTGAPKPGFLLGTRKMELFIDCFEVGKRYEIEATCIFSDSEGASFECAIYDGEATVAKATLNAYRPPDAHQFLKEQAKANT